jgi:predicted permease
MTKFVQDFTYGFHMLLRRPGFTAIAALSLALGIGANTVVFSLINGLLLRQLGYPEPNRLVWIWAYPANHPEQSGSLFGSDFLALRDQNQVFSSIGGQWIDRPSTVGAEENGEPAERITGQQVTPGFFPTLGVNPLLGRTFTEEEDAVGNTAHVMVLSFDYWQRRFNGSNEVLGKTLRLDGEITTIIGVMPRRFGFFSEKTDFWSPVPLTRTVLDSAGFGLATIGRLKPGVSMKQAEAQIAGFGAQRALADPGRDKVRANRIENLQEGAYGDLRSPLLLLQGAVAFVLLIGCANMAGLLLARAASRRTEIAVRTAIGASRGQVVRQLVTETIPLALVGGVLGVMLAWGGLRLFVAYAPSGFLPLTEFALDATTLGFAAAVAIATSLVFGIVPALQASKTDLVSSL